MVDQELEDRTSYRVVKNHEEQYSIWPEGRNLPAGWEETGKSGTRAECLKYIEEVWTDMRPLSLRRKMEQPASTDAKVASPHELPTRDSRDDLVQYLSQGDHPVRATSASPEQFVERLRTGYVNIRFTDTRGGTELGLKLDSGASDMAQADFARRQGIVCLAGDLTLNYRPVRLTAEIALDTLEGLGRLQARV